MVRLARSSLTAVSQREGFVKSCLTAAAVRTGVVSLQDASALWPSESGPHALVLLYPETYPAVLPTSAGAGDGGRTSRGPARGRAATAVRPLSADEAIAAGAAASALQLVKDQQSQPGSLNNRRGLYLALFRVPQTRPESAAPRLRPGPTATPSSGSGATAPTAAAAAVPPWVTKLPKQGLLRSQWEGTPALVELVRDGSIMEDLGQVLRDVRSKTPSSLLSALADVLRRFV